MKSIESLIVKWNREWSWDYVWRKKYNVPFNSEQHKSMSPLDIRLDLIEERMIQDQIDREKIVEDDLKEYRKTGEWWKAEGDDQIDENDEELFDGIVI
jgi:hypothetical protein